MRELAISPESPRSPLGLARRIVAAIALATPEIGEVLALGRPREHRQWWKGLR